MKFDHPAGWEQTILGQVLTLKRGYDLPARTRRQGSVPIVSSSGISGFHDTAKVGAPGVVTGRYGTIGEVFYLEQDFWPLNTSLYVEDFKGNDPRYCAELLKTVNFRAYDGKSGVPGINRNDVHTADVLVPPRQEQERIAALLGTLDEKIGGNLRLAGLLKEISATLFRARFVDFLGVEDLIESEIGPIPRGWRAGALTDLGRFVNGKAFTKLANGYGRPIIRIRELNAGIDSNTPRSDVNAVDEHIARDGDILFAWSGSLDVYRWAGPESLINQHIFKVLPETTYPAWFVYQWIRQHMTDFRGIARDKATTMGHIQRHHLAEALLPIPDAGAIKSARDALDAIDNQQMVLAAERTTLGALRDALLPRLISGALRVPDAADIAEVIEPSAEGS